MADKAGFPRLLARERMSAQAVSSAGRAPPARSWLRAKRVTGRRSAANLPRHGVLENSSAALRGWSRVLLAGLVTMILGLASGAGAPAFAQAVQAEDLESLLATVEDEDRRKVLIDQLKALIEARRAATPGAPGGEPGGAADRHGRGAHPRDRRAGVQRRPGAQRLPGAARVAAPSGDRCRGARLLAWAIVQAGRRFPPSAWRPSA